MAFAITTAYDGEWSRDYYSQLLLGAKTPALLGSAGSILARVKDKLTIPNLEVGNVLQADACAFNASGDVTITEKSISVCDMMIGVELCKTDLETTFESQRMTAGALNTEIPSELSTYITDRVKLKGQNQVEQIIWKGDTSLTGDATLKLCDGFFKKFLADADVVDVSGTSVTASNVLAELTKVYNDIPDIVYNEWMNGNANLKLMVSTNIARAYKQALNTSSGNANFNVSEDTPLFYQGLEMVVMDTFPNNRMVCTFLENLWLATDLVEDFDNVELIDMQKTTGDKKVRMIGRMKLGVEYKFGAYIVYYA
jgi:hypothetical protein